MSECLICDEFFSVPARIEKKQTKTGRNFARFVYNGLFS
ncbi:hypothetical protein AB434_0453 [Heyndrickxia coagulans]|uniref:Uncharacterized protein n=1 Tax=Heyndrickxia coagulans TaxID=1398 RepID=A0AAN0T3V2_HEYCO|nr:hypothetical protein SB48_HM08orf01110 [Heyndrickxia coagulans]AKN52858.1 hypothetical protein AB434_0453 [Heyndrickxia coagulans]KYC65942.1 hypothetical protein B4100_2053 [Heyndrickxia coagulans]